MDQERREQHRIIGIIMEDAYMLPFGPVAPPPWYNLHSKSMRNLNIDNRLFATIAFGSIYDITCIQNRSDTNASVVP